MEAEIRARIPGIDPLITDYSVGYLTHASHSLRSDRDSSGPTPLEEAASTITSLLVSASGDQSPTNEVKVQELVRQSVAKLGLTNGINGDARPAAPTTRRLDQAIQVGTQRTMSSTLGLVGTGVDLESTSARKVESRVDRKKLEKAERKIQAKQERKVMKNVEYESSRLLNRPEDAQSYEEFYMAVNPLQLGSEAQSASKSKDIKVEGIDLSIGGQRILTDASLTLAYARRYCLVGINGVGKSYVLHERKVASAEAIRRTLLRALSRREIAIPVHISILHVAQEVRLKYFKSTKNETDIMHEERT